MAKKPPKTSVRLPDPPEEKPLAWVSGTRKTLKGFPRAVRLGVGTALYRAQIGGQAENAKVLKGFKGASVIEVVEDYDGNTYRAVYTVRFRKAVFVLDVFQKKSSKGIATQDHITDRIKDRLAEATREYKRLFGDA
jgi:phage-related protein